MKSARFKAWVDLGGSLVLLLPVMALIMWTSWGYVLASWSKFEESREAGGLPSLFLLEDRYKGVLQLIALATAQGVGEEAIYLQARATETRVRSMDLSDYRILAFATHGLVSGEMKGLAEPSLVFTPLQWGVIAPPFSYPC